MLSKEPARTWASLSLLGGAACLYLLSNYGLGRTMHLWAGLIGGLLTVVALWIVLAPIGSLRRSLAQVKDDIQAGRQRSTTTLQKTCIVLALLLVAVQVCLSLR